MALRRLDYPTQCFDVNTFRKAGEESLTSLSASNKKILIVASTIQPADKFDPAINMAMFYLKEETTPDILTLETCSKARLEWEETSAQNSLRDTKLFFLPKAKKVLNSPIADVMEQSYHFGCWLKDNEENYSSVIILCCTEVAYYPLLSRKTTAEFSQLTFTIFLRSSSYFNHIKTTKPVLSISQLTKFYTQRIALQLADRIVSNSIHYLNWMAENEFESNDLEKCHFNDIPIDYTPPLPAETKSRKGQYITFIFSNNSDTELIFCIEAIKRLGKPSLQFKFIIPNNLNKKIKKLLKVATKNGNNPISCNLHVFESVNWNDVIRRSSIVIIPNQEKIPSAFLAWVKYSKVTLFANGQLSHIKTNAVTNLTFIPFVHNPQKISEHLKLMIDSPLYDSQSDNAENYNIWRKIGCKSKGILPENKLDKTISISVCIAHYNRANFLKRAIDSVLSQSYPCEEIIIVDDGSTIPSAISYLAELKSKKFKIPIKVIQQQNLYIGASRNTGLSVAKSKYILFMDDDNEAKRDELEIFVNAALKTTADILTCFSTIFSGDSPALTSTGLKQALFVGPNMSCAHVSNPFGDSNMFARVEAIKSIGGFSENYKVGRDDQELFLRAQMNGLKIELVPLPLYYYRLSKTRIRSSHLNPYSGFTRLLQSQLNSHLSVDTVQQIAYLQGLAYANGPFGPIIKISSRLYSIKEFARIYLAKFPILYSIFIKLRQLLY